MRSAIPLVLGFLFFLGLFVFFLRWTVQQDLPVVGEPPPMPPEVAVPRPSGVDVQEVARGLGEIRALETAAGGRIFVAERSGRIAVVDAGEDGAAETWTELPDVEVAGEGGLLGLALHPAFPEEPWVYAMHSASAVGGRENRIVRIREEDGRGGDPEVLRKGLPAGEGRNGGTVAFGPDGRLYLAIGDVGEPVRAQDPHDPAGAVLRLHPDGAIPEDNPWEGSPAWAVGLREVAGLAWHPRTEALFAADHGPSGEWPGIEHLDELNRVAPGGNYGWPLVVGAPGVEDLEDPVLAWVPAIAPGDLLFLGNEDAGVDLFLSALGRPGLLRIRFQDPVDPDAPSGIEAWFDGEGAPTVGPTRALAAGSDGSVYVGEAHPDGPEGTASAGDRILRLVPPEEGWP